MDTSRMCSYTIECALLTKQCRTYTNNRRRQHVILRVVECKQCSWKRC